MKEVEPQLTLDRGLYARFASGRFTWVSVSTLFISPWRHAQLPRSLLPALFADICRH